MEDLFLAIRSSSQCALSQCHSGAQSVSSENRHGERCYCEDARSGSSQFEVLYVARVELSHYRPPAGLVDQAVLKFRLFENQCLSSSAAASRLSLSLHVPRKVLMFRSARVS